jgi:hypothetical protein
MDKVDLPKLMKKIIEDLEEVEMFQQVPAG